jgi:hypothetical protein
LNEYKPSASASKVYEKATEKRLWERYLLFENGLKFGLSSVKGRWGRVTNLPHIKLLDDQPGHPYAPFGLEHSPGGEFVHVGNRGKDLFLFFAVVRTSNSFWCDIGAHYSQAKFRDKRNVLRRVG